MTARDDILVGIRRALRRGTLPEEAAAVLAERVAAHRRNMIPARAAALDPAARIVVLRAGQVVASYEDGWDLVRARSAGVPEGWPRTINLITGPSRTGDIEQRIQLGAHGPRRLHIVLIDEPEGGANAPPPA